jgi:hypothetical protein
MFQQTSFFNRGMINLPAADFMHAASTNPMEKSLRSWSDELYDIIFELEEGNDNLDRLRDLQRSIDTMLESVRHDTSHSSANSASGHTGSRQEPMVPSYVPRSSTGQ